MRGTDAHPRGGFHYHAREVPRRSEQKSPRHAVRRAGLIIGIAVLVALSVPAIESQDRRTWSHTQSVARNSGAGSNALAFPSATDSGSLIIAQVDWSEDSDFISIGDVQGNVFMQVGGEQHSPGIGVRSRLYYAANIRGGADAVTTIVSGSPLCHELYLHEYSGLDPIAPLDAFSVNEAVGTTFTGGAITTATSHELLYGIEIDSLIASAANGWSTRSALNGNVAADGDASSPASYAFTGKSTGAYIAWTVAFKQSGTAPTVPVVDNTAPTAPSGISATPISGSEVNLSWMPSTDPDNSAAEITYTVFRDGLKVAGTNAGVTTYQDTGLVPGTTYSYSISASDPAGNTSAQSAPAQATTRAVPGPVIGFFSATPASITAGLSTVLSWDVSNATWVSIDNGIGSITGLTSIVVSPTASVTYRLTASNATASVSAQVTVSVSSDSEAPSIPTNVSVVFYSSSEVLISWTASNDNIGVTGYKILRNGVQIGETTTSVYSDTNLVANTMYAYAVAAYDATGNSSAWSQTTSLTTQSPSDVTTYATTFPLAENPISEGGRWINGKAAGLDWSDVAAIPGLAIGTQTGSDGFNDSVAILDGNWGPDQSAMATVHIAKPQDTSAIKEVEILLRWAISARSARGYEINFGTTGQYVQIVRWDGRFGNFTYLDARPLPNGLRDGDVVKATIVGELLTAFVNDTPVAEVKDSTYPGGSPGMGFYLQGTATSVDFGFSSYLASGQTGGSWAHLQSTARNSGAGSNALALPSVTGGGNLIIVEVDWSNASDFLSISDSQGNAFTQVGTEQEHLGVGVKSRLYYAANISGGSETVTTVVNGSPGYHELYVHEYSGLDATSPLDTFSVKVANKSAFSSGNITTSASHDLLYGIEIDSRSATAAADWTTRSRLDSNVAADRDAPTAGTYAYTGESTGAFIAWIVAFKQATNALLPPNAISTSSSDAAPARTTPAVLTTAQGAPR